MEYVIGIDIGGTATDCVVVDEKGEVTTSKAFSTPPTFIEGVMDSLEIAGEKLGIDLSTLFQNTSRFLHSTTVAENALVTGDVAKAGLIVTRGFEEVLVIMRGRGRWVGLTEDEMKSMPETDKPVPIIPRSLIRGVKERTDTSGQVLLEPDEDEVERAIDDLVGKGVEAIGVCLLNSFANPSNEKVVKKLVQKLHPELFLTLSSELAPIPGEYERTSTVALNVKVGPFTSRYLTKLKATLEQKGFKGTLLIMQAHGGLLSLEDASTQPVGMIESGPVSGLLGSRFIGNALGFGNIVAADLGGTTFKCGKIERGLIEYQRMPIVLRYNYQLPKMDVTSIGLAGGSIIWLDPRTKTPRIGPRSAGAHPGPACYGFGGTEPTLTDVDLVLGYLNSDFFLEGRAALDREAALQAFKSQIADPLGMDVIEAASATYRLANSLAYDMLHKMTIERGVDPRNYVLFSYGGTAGMHLPGVAQELQVKQVLIPHAAAVMGASGLISADIVHEYWKYQQMSLPVKVDALNDVFQKLVDKAEGQLKSEGFSKESILMERFIDFRYKRQLHEVTVPLEVSGTLSENDLAKVTETFERMYEERYGKGSGHSEAGIEMVAFRIRGIGTISKPKLRTYEQGGRDPGAALVETRKVHIYTGAFKGTVDARCYDFQKLLPGNEIEGPAIIWTPITTVVVNPGQRAMLDGYKNILVTW